MELTNSQKLVIETKNKSLLVSASAGSGKTFVVVQRIIESIKKGQDVAGLLVLTFTNAAASELKEKIINALHELKNSYESQNDTANAKKIARQIARVPMADISTIHSFCLNVIRNNFYNLGIDPNITTLDATKSVIMLNEAIYELIEEEYEKQSKEFLDMLDIIGSEEALIDAIYTLYLSYNKMVDKDKWLELCEKRYSLDKTEVKDLTQTDFGSTIFKLVKDKLKLLTIELTQMIDKLDGASEFESRKAMLEGINKKILEAQGKVSYDELYNYLPIFLDIPRLPATRVSDEELKEEIKALRSKIKDEFEKIGQIMYKDTKGILQELNSSSGYINWLKTAVIKVQDKYMAAKKEKGAIDFADYEQLALQVLDNEETRKKYIEKYDEIYIDEYQDTSNIQEAIISKIAKSNNVIMVGDVKQSIYGFRNAKPELFTRKYKLYKEVNDNNLEEQGKIILAKNFRSRKEIIESTNEVFSKLMTMEFGGADYNESEALVYGQGYQEADDDSYKSEIHIIEKSDDEVSIETEDVSNIEIEAVAVSKKIEDIINSKLQIYDKKLNATRNCEYKDIVILLRNVEGKANVVSDVLRQNGIPAFADTKSGFFSSDEISLIVAFLKVLDNIYDDISLTSVMYSIIGKFSLDDLAYIRQNSSNMHMIDSLKKVAGQVEDNKLNDKICRFIELINRYTAYVGTYKITDILLKLYNETGIYMALRLEQLGELKCANLDNFIQIIYEYENSESLNTLYLLNKYLDNLKNKESAGDSPKLLGENENVVRIMTIHKSKGLEFPVVILMNVGAKYNEQDVKEKLVIDDELGIGMDIYSKEQSITYPSIIKQAIKLKTKVSLRAEALRLLYVAFTRAKEKLIIYSTVNSYDKFMQGMVNPNMAKLIVPDFNSYLKCIMQSLSLNNSNFSIIRHKASSYLNLVEETENVSIDRNISKIEKLKQVANELDIGVDEKLKKQIEKENNLSYKYDNLKSVNQKYSVSELKAKDDDINILELKPNVLETKVSGTSYGTFVHETIQKVGDKAVNKELIESIAKELITEKSLEGRIDSSKVVCDVLTMYQNINNILNGAKVIKNELEFVINDDLSFIPELKLTSKTLIQGVIDMYVETQNRKHIIIDFKTDKVINKEDLIDRYAIQLKIYKRAMELCYSTSIDGIYIYSFALKELIEVK